MSSTPKNDMIHNPYLRKRKHPCLELDKQQKQPTQSFKAIDQDQGESSSTSPKLAANNNTDIHTNLSVAANRCSNFNGISASALIISAADKAGMQGIDRCKIDAIILQQQRQRDEKVNQKIRQLRERLQQASPKEYQVTTELEEQLEEYQRQLPTRSTWVVVDMDMFFMACELLSRPHLRHVPACVGHGMISTSNYIARRYGVRSAMAGFIGDKLVHELSGGTQKLIHVRSNYELYRQKSLIVKNVLREYDPYHMQSYSLDEAYLDIGPYLTLYLQHQDWTHEQIRDRLVQDKEEGHHHYQPRISSTTFLQSQSSMTCMEAANHVVGQLRQRVEEVTGGLTCSAGVAPNVSLAKIASDRNKPNGQFLVDPSQVLDFVHSLPIRKIPGIGRVTEKILQQVGNVYTVHDLYQQRGLVQWLFSPATAEFLLKACVGCNGSSTINTSDFGIDNEDLGADMSSSDHPKGISRERTFPPESDWSQLCIRLEDISRKLAKDMIQKSVMAHTVTVKVKLTSFDVVSRGQSMKRGVYLQSPEELVECASDLFAQIRARFKKDHAEDGASRFSVRLLGIRCSNLISKSLLESSDRGSMDQYLQTQSESLALEASNTTVLDDESHTSIDQLGTPNPLVNRYSIRKIGKHSNRSHSPSRWVVETDRVANNSGDSKSIVKPYLRISSLHSGQIGGNDDDVIATTATIDQDKEAEVYCPLCYRQFSTNDNTGLNAHIDTCLNSSTIRRTIHEANSKVTELKAKRSKRLTDFWNSSKGSTQKTVH
jgi:DNA polymerase kappa